ncbi:hypothetical protein CapIbe_007971 [Capra ibex]
MICLFCSHSVVCDPVTRVTRYIQLCGKEGKSVHVPEVTRKLFNSPFHTVFFTLKKAIRKKKQNPKRRIINLHKKNFVNVIDHNFDIYDQILSY